MIGRRLLRCRSRARPASAPRRSSRPSALTGLGDHGGRVVQRRCDADNVEYCVGRCTSWWGEGSEPRGPVLIAADHETRLRPHPPVLGDGDVDVAVGVRLEQAELLGGRVVAPRRLGSGVEQRGQQPFAVPDRSGVGDVHAGMNGLPPLVAERLPNARLCPARREQLGPRHDLILLVDQRVDALVTQLLRPPPLHPPQDDGFRRPAPYTLWTTASARSFRKLFRTG